MAFRWHQAAVAASCGGGYLVLSRAARGDKSLELGCVSPRLVSPPFVVLPFPALAFVQAELCVPPLAGSLVGCLLRSKPGVPCSDPRRMPMRRRPFCRRSRLRTVMQNTALSRFVTRTRTQMNKSRRAQRLDEVHASRASRPDPLCAPRTRGALLKKSRRKIEVTVERLPVTLLVPQLDNASLNEFLDEVRQHRQLTE